MSLIQAKKYLKQFDRDQDIIEFDVSSATVELAAQALNCIPGRIAKSLSFKINDQAILIVTAGDTKIDNHKYKETFKTKAKMLSRDEVLPIIGHDVGGVCPFGINPNVTVYLDESLKRFNTVFPACGSSNSAIELTIEDLQKYVNASWIDVCKTI
ncbi:MAG: YbaK/EbsC family protein [Thomasclavelia sp.]